jgi:hypothetical protein
MTRSFIGSKNFKSRGALSNPAGRFDSTTRATIDDGWYADEVPESVNEVVLPDSARSVISTNDSPDVGFDQSINPYRGCAHGCVYCFARPTHAYLDLSPGLDFETKLFYKANAVELLEAELSKRGYVCKPIALGINTDGYQPLEKKLEVTRGILKVLAQTRHPVTIVTKSALVIRDAQHHVLGKRYQANAGAANRLAAGALAGHRNAGASRRPDRCSGRSGDSSHHGS